jgi:PKHD-type hydroxylase
VLAVFADVLEPAELRQVLEGLERHAFADGKRSAGLAAARVKENEELPPGDDALELSALVARAIDRHEGFHDACWPHTILHPMFSRYLPGMRYGAHSDSPVMHDDVRTDLAMTLFLSDPASYDGGELVVDVGPREHRVKAPMNHLVVYACGNLHRVEPLTRGVRLAAVSWAQSMIRDPRAREILYDLSTARAAVLAEQGKTHTYDLISKSWGNLVRLWVEV